MSCFQLLQTSTRASKAERDLIHFNTNKNTAMLDLQTNNPFFKFKVRNLFYCSCLIFVALDLVLGVIKSWLNWNSEDPIATDIFYCLSMVLLCLWALRKLSQLSINSRYLIGKLPHGYSWLTLFGLVAALLLFSFGILLLTFYLLSLHSTSLAESLLEPLDAENPSTSSFPIISYLLYIFSSVVVAPVSEEFIFRGIFLHRWATKWGASRAILVSSIIFGFLHIDFLGALVFGIVMALLYIKTRTLIVPMVAHAMNNTIVTAILLFSTDNNTSETTNFSEFWQLGLIFIVVSSPFVIYFIYKNWYSQRVSLPYFANAQVINSIRQ